ncbi:SDR family NAD(P)-dependent oxidoreductase [Kribbella pratensis]|uniref:NAD(P)-dependent dehydrogenase (Short-subunit alcohol dehydrogenase family) n=1 Tax=Kribbella pratensis TaxID=2512112 RepID=A0A4R8CK43_9ACTN|nr:SDR family oxidoreductase [Kribbella pratensis]TDW76565.1 NAD(P)-dependent dehydrogenase (short-subunit alcohol dehydrogenase family) [Kribbella pratensis]
MTQDFAGRTALVTGGNSGIGRAVADQLARRGAHVVISGRDVARGTKAVEEIRADGGTADFVRADLARLDEVRSLAKQAIELGGGHVDVLINNAGIFPFGPTAETADSDFDAVYAVNVRAPFYLVAELAPLMAARGSGAIVNVTTMVAYFGMAGMAAYGSSKAAVELLTRSWAAEFGAAGVRVNAVSPGPTRTEGTAGMGENLNDLAGTTPLQRVGRPEEVAAGIVFLASDEASLIHGATLPVDGGRLAV